MNFFDALIINFFNHFSRISWTADYTISFVSENQLIKGVILILIYWWAWFRADKNQTAIHRHIISTFLGCFIAMVLARGLALTLPFRLRPLHDATVHFLLPYGMRPGALEGWSSFPSDHAVLFYALSTGMFYISKKIGIFAVIYTTLLIGLPRIYLGLHYPTDIFGGAVVGVYIVFLCNSRAFIDKISTPILGWSRTNPEIFYPLFFLITYQIADMFVSSREFFGFFKSILHAMNI
ncbi:MAG: phosphatase PAP2 family protein [Deferribacteres bacterium]|nr:phosphatase PAP2 family protein [candidate division KSB1 bacterium]MCB9502708.1 phosphatase PAP2 family protein [Deferribacteres bacterium]